MADGLTIEIKGLEGVLDTLNKLPPEIVSKRGGPVKKALRKGALVLLREAKFNLYRVTADIGTGDDVGTGLLQKSLIVSRGKTPFDGNGERYLVRVKRASYNRHGKVVTTLKTAQLLEYGSSQQPAEPWLRPAFASKSQQAMDVTINALKADIDRTVKRLAKPKAK